MILKKFLGIGALVVVLTACTNSAQKNEVDTVTLSYNQLYAQQNVLGTNWYQTSGEARALYLQGYNIATENLKEHLKVKSPKPYSIVLDLDETVLDNSPYQAENIKLGRGFDPVSWDEWVKKGVAKAVPGAKDFLNFANNNEVEIYYISDRTDDQLEATIENLVKEGIPVQGKDHVLLKSKDDKSGKVNRRNYVLEHTNLIMLFGDNLSDFDVFSSKSIMERNDKVEELRSEFGNKFIIFPNPLYGAFESAIYNGEHKNYKEKVEMREETLIDYENLE